MESILPRDITWRIDKIGYEPPQESWMQSEAVNARIKIAKEKYSDVFGREFTDKVHGWQLFCAANF